MLRSNKRAVSTIIAYVLLIGLAVSMSVLVHNWLKLHVAPDESQTCPEAVSLSIENSYCNAKTGLLNLTFKNRGNFIIEDVSVKISDDEAVGGIDKLNLNNAINLGIGESKEVSYIFDQTKYDLVKTSILYITVQPVVFEDGDMIYCSQTITSEVECETN